MQRPFDYISNRDETIKTNKKEHLLKDLSLVELLANILELALPQEILLDKGLSSISSGVMLDPII